MVRVSIAQVAPVFLDKDKTVEKAIAVIREAASHGAELVAFPETWIPTYPIWAQGATGWDDPVVKRSYARLLDNSIAVPGPEIDLIRSAARETGATVVLGINERDGQYSRGTLYNSQVFISGEGQLLGVRRKLMPTHHERLFWGLGDGRGLEVYDTPFGRLGGSICWEHWMPLNRFAMHSLGEQIHVAAFPDLPPFHYLAAQSYAFEGRCFVLATGMVLTMSDIPEDFELRDYLAARGTDTLLCGGAAVVGPDGQWVVEPVGAHEEIVYADIDLGRIGEEQLQLDVAGHYNRPDVFHLHVTKGPRVPVTWTTGSGCAEPEDAE